MTLPETLRAMLAAGASAELIVLAVEAAYAVEAQRKAKHADYMREWRHVKSRELTKRKAPTPPKEKLPPVLPTEELSPNGFDEFWLACPKKVGKGEAKKAYRNALKRATEAEILAGMKRYAASRVGQDAAYTKTPGPWLNADRWLDEPDKKPSAGVGGNVLSFRPEPPKVSNEEWRKMREKHP